MGTYTFKVPIGDPSDDGHGKADIFTVECNHGILELKEAYKQSCEKLQIAFDHGTLKLGWTHPESKARTIAVEYGDSKVSDLAYNILKENSISVNGGDDEDDDYKYWIEGPEELLSIVMQFIKLSLPDLEYKVIGEKLPSLDLGIGYGLYH